MDNKMLTGLSDETIDQIVKTSKKLESENLKRQIKQIYIDSPYSNEINMFFSGYEEFAYMVSLGLRESEFTRKSLIREIDLDLYVTEKGNTNRELMLQGCAPYASDDKDDFIILHHIGQKPEAPFAELTNSEHMRFGNNKLLHQSEKESWRNDGDTEKLFLAEREQYWMQRAKKNVDSRPINVKNIKKFSSKEDKIVLVKQAIEKLFSECSISDLRYISNLAENYMVINQFGVSTVEEFVLSLSKEDERTIFCPYCNSNKIIFYGRVNTAKECYQKYKCSDCGHYFSVLNNCIISNSSFSLFEWIKYIDCLYNGYSIKKTAKLCNISEPTAHNNRIKLFYALKILESSVRLSGNIVIDETYIQESRKGNRGKDFKVVAKREAHRRGHENKKPGTSDNQVCIVCALDDRGNSVARIAGTKNPTIAKLHDVLDDCIEKKDVSCIYSDCSSAIYSFATENGYPIKQSIALHKHGENVKPGRKNKVAYQYVQRVNSYHSRLKRFIENFNGVSSDWLAGYMYLFSWKERNRDNDTTQAYKELLSIMVAPGLYKSTEQIVEEKIIKSPFDIEESYTFKKRFMSKESEKKALKMFELYGKGKTYKQIAERFDCSTEAVRKAIRKCDVMGLGYITKRDLKKEEQKNMHLKLRENEIKEIKKSRDFLFTLLEEKNAWNGNSNDFYEAMMAKYSLCRQTIKNNIAYAKRVRDLQETFSIGEKYEYITLKEIYEDIYSCYLKLTEKFPNKPNEYYYNLLAKEFNYTAKMITSVVTQMKKGTIDWNLKPKTSMPKTQTLNRDRSVFIDYLKWNGTRSEFKVFAGEKYGLSPNVIGHIIYLNFMADINRYEITQ